MATTQTPSSSGGAGPAKLGADGSASRTGASSRSGRSSRERGSSRQNSSRSGRSGRRERPQGRKELDKVYRNVQIKGDHPAIWAEHFRARTAPKTEILIGKNTVIGPGVNIIAEKGSIHIGDNNIISEGTLIINKSKEKLIIGNGNRFECGASLVISILYIFCH